MNETGRQIEPAKGDPVRPADALPESGKSDANHPALDSCKQNESQNPLHRFGLSRGDQLFVAVFIFISLVLMFVYWLRLSGWGMQPIEIEQLEPRDYVFQVDMNRATWVEWSQLEGIGPALAHRIVEDRERNGPFKTIDDLSRVPGIGPKRIEQLRPWLVIRPQEPN